MSNAAAYIATADVNDDDYYKNTNKQIKKGKPVFLHR